MWIFHVVLALVFSTLAALCAFIITYEEYRRHFPEKKTPLKMAAKTSLVAFSFFMILTMVAMAILRLF